MATLVVAVGLALLVLVWVRSRRGDGRGEPRARRGPGWRKMTWVVLAFNALMLVWLVAGLSTTSDSAAKCEAEYPPISLLPNASAEARRIQAQSILDRPDEIKACEAGSAVGASIGAALIVSVWVAGDVILGVLWLVTRPRDRRACPVCGSEVAIGLTVCPSCGYDYRTAVAGGV